MLEIYFKKKNLLLSIEKRKQKSSPFLLIKKAAKQILEFKNLKIFHLNEKLFP